MSDAELLKGVPRPAGRPRDDAAGPALLDAARRLVIRDGYRAVSIQAIVDAAGVGRQTLYRRWSSKAELVLDAFFQSAGMADMPSEGPVREVLCSFLDGIFANLRHDGPAIRSLIASAQEDPEFLESFRARFVRPRAAITAAILRAASDREELVRNADIETALDVIHGAFWYRLLQGEQLDAAYAERLTDFVIRSLAFAARTGP